MPPLAGGTTDAGGAAGAGPDGRKDADAITRASLGDPLGLKLPRSNGGRAGTRGDTLRDRPSKGGGSNVTPTDSPWTVAVAGRNGDRAEGTGDAPCS